MKMLADLAMVWIAPILPSNKELKNYYKEYFPIGVAVSPRALLDDEASLIRHEFNSLTPENANEMDRYIPKGGNISGRMPTTEQTFP